MRVISAALLGALLCTVVSASLKAVEEEHRTAFFGEDVHIDVPPGDTGEVVFKPRTTNSSSEVVLLREGKLVSSRAVFNSLGHLVLEDVQEEDEGVYEIRDSNHPNTAEHLILVVRDCALEEGVKYGDPYKIHLTHVEGPITLEFRHGLVQHGHTPEQNAVEPPAVVLWNQSAVSAEEYVGRLSVSQREVKLHSVRMGDEGSFTVLDREGKVRRRNCLNVRDHQDFKRVPYGGHLKMKLYLHHSQLNVVFRPKSGSAERAVVERGTVVTPLDPLLEGRLTVGGAELSLKKVHEADAGVFRVTDLDGFLVADVHIEVEGYRLHPLTLAILSMLCLVAFMLLVCLLSCLYNIHMRKEKNMKLSRIAQHAGKKDGDDFRQVVQDAYTRFAEESQMHSVCENPSESTEVTIKGLEVSKPGRYQALSSDNFLEMSDSGVEFTSSGLPLDSDTDAMTTYDASHKPLLNAVSPTAVTEDVGLHHSSEATTMATHLDDHTACRTPDSALSGVSSPVSNHHHSHSAAAGTPDDGSLLCGTVMPEATTRGDAGLDTAKTEAAVENGEAGQQKAESPLQST